MPIDTRALVKELDRLAVQPASVEDWRDLYETIEAYKLRCLARAIAGSAQRSDLVAAIQVLAEGE
jgi:DNA-binding transcriptional regulator YdaS (Cro superfamily)